MVLGVLNGVDAIAVDSRGVGEVERLDESLVP
jgi:hypothetical protein